MEYQEFLYEVEKKMNQKLKGGITASVHIAVKNNGRIKKGILIEESGSQYFADNLSGGILRTISTG